MGKIDQFYKERWNQKSDWTSIGVSKKQRFNKLIEFLYKYKINVQNSRVLDYGCGTGWLLYFLKDLGFKDLNGFDVTPSTLLEVKKKFPFVNTLWSIDEPFEKRIPNGVFDLVTSIEVIEHVPLNEKTHFVKQLCQAIKKDGYLYITTPNGKYKRTGIKKEEYQPIEEWSNPKELIDLLESNGFEILEKGSFYFKKYLSWYHAILLSRIFQKSCFKNFVENVMRDRMLGLSMYFFCKKK